MKASLTLACILTAVLAGSVQAEDVHVQTPQQASLASVNLNALQNGVRTSKVIGSSVVNDQGETLGKVDDIIIGPDRKSLYAVISVGGVLGVGGKRVVVLYEDISFVDGKVRLPGATKDSLEKLPQLPS